MRQFIFLLFLLCSIPGAVFAGEKQSAGPVPPVLPAPSIKEAAENDPYLYKDIAFFLRALAIVRENYVDKEKVSDSKLLKAALRGTG